MSSQLPASIFGGFTEAEFDENVNKLQADTLAAAHHANPRKDTRMNIEKNIPIPAQRGDGRWKDLADQMGVGDSVVLANRWEANSLCNRMRKVGKKTTSRKMEAGDDASTPIRVWRVE